MLRTITLLLLVFAARNAPAQNIAVQQPVLQDFSVETTVTVPDRGSTLLGSVRSSAAGRTSYGFGPLRNTARGSSQTGSSVTTSVYIHDLRAIDDALLAVPGPAAPPVSRWEAALSARLAADRPNAPGPVPPEENLDQRLKLERLARAAEDRRQMSLARAYWRAAARHGSTAAADKLAAR